MTIARHFNIDDNLDISSFENHIKQYIPAKEASLNVTVGDELWLQYKENDGKQKKDRYMVNAFVYDNNSSNQHFIIAKKNDIYLEASKILGEADDSK